MLIMGGMSRLYAPQGQPAHSQGQSEAAPWVMNAVGSAFALQGRVFKNSHQNLLKKVSILSAFRLLIFNTFKVKIVL